MKWSLTGARAVAEREILLQRVETVERQLAEERAAHLATCRRFTQTITHAVESHLADARHVSQSIAELSPGRDLADAAARVEHHLAVAHTLGDVARDLGLDQ